MFDAQYMICIDQFVRYKDKRNKDSKEEDWENLIEFKDGVWCQDVYDEWQEVFKRSTREDRDPERDEHFARRDATKNRVQCLKQEVVDWLNENVADDAKGVYNDNKKGWAMGNDQYRGTGSSTSLTLWFYRKRDAMAFVKRWSTHGKPTTYLNYFKDEYKELIDGKLTIVER
jgi:hypothetical protein